MANLVGSTRHPLPKNQKNMACFIVIVLYYTGMHVEGGGHDVGERDSGRVAPQGERFQIQHPNVSCLR